MSLPIRFACLTIFFTVLYMGQIQAVPLGERSTVETTEVSIVESASEISPSTTAIDTLGETNTRVKRQGGGCGCGCGCGCCCCRPRCCCCCTRCCTCCTTRCCTCCRPCCCGCGGGCGGGCGCCGCCGCGGGGRKRRALQQLQIKLADKLEQENKTPFPAPIEETIAELPETSEHQESHETSTEWPAPVFELVTENYA